MRHVRCGTRERWLATRRIGSSDVARILGRSPYGGPYAVWRRLIGRPLPDLGSPDQVRGTKWEPVVSAAYEAETGLKAYAPEPWSLYVGPEEWGTDTPDRIVEDAGDWGPAELKTDMVGRGWGPSQAIPQWSPDAPIRPDYALQCYHHMWALDSPWCDLAVLLPRYDLRVYRIHRDHELERSLTATLRGWHQHHVVERHPVAPEGSRPELMELGQRFAPDQGQKYQPRQATPEERRLIEELASVRAVGKFSKQRQQLLSFALLSGAGRTSALLLGRHGKDGRASIVRPEGGIPHLRLSGAVTQMTRSKA